MYIISVNNAIDETAEATIVGYTEDESIARKYVNKKNILEYQDKEYFYNEFGEITKDDIPKNDLHKMIISCDVIFAKKEKWLDEAMDVYLTGMTEITDENKNIRDTFNYPEYDFNLTMTDRGFTIITIMDVVKNDEIKPLIDYINLIESRIKNRILHIYKNNPPDSIRLIIDRFEKKI